uniref:Ribosomal RNA small subunit methyltransferase G n=1 Tax=Cyanothece sp. (strain PCC 7425 / ATCC 29141) TaxID=395961 RepID=B8HVL1_CYAP4
MNELIAPQLPQQVELWQQTLNWQPTIAQQQQFQQLYELILTGNQQLNLTRITAPLEFWEKHLWDSLSGIAPFLSPAQTDTSSHWQAIDIGTGAGFPGLVVAIVRPDWQLTLIDSTRKKISWLESTVAELGLSNVRPIWGRAEELNQHPGYHQGFDLGLIRAVASADRCAAYSLPFLKPGGLAILYRGQWSASEQESLNPVLRRLGGKIESVQTWQTPLTHGDRHCLYLRKL